MEKPLFIILAGGIGKRFYPFETDKTLFPFCGKSIIEHLIFQLESAGVQKALVVTNPTNHEIIQKLNTKIDLSCHMLHKPTGMGDAVLSVKNQISNQPCVIINAVDLFEPSLFKSLLSQVSDTPLLVGKEIQNYFPGGYLVTKGKTVTSIIEKPAPGTEPSNVINLVVHYFPEPKIFIDELEKIQSDRDDTYEQALLQLMNKKTVGFIPYSGSWVSLKYGYHVLDTMQFFLSQTSPFCSKTAQIHPSAHISGNVYIDEDAEVQEGAVIKGPTYIGKGVKVGPLCFVRQSIVEEKAVIGFGSEVARSYVGPRCMLHHNFIGDSVLEAEVNPSWGTCTANLRIDKKRVRIKLKDGSWHDTNREKLGSLMGKGTFLKINSSLMPGTILSEKSQL